MAQVGRALGITEQTFYRWRTEYGGLKLDQAKRLKDFPQTSANATRMGQTLFDLLNGKNLRLYPASDLRARALSTVAVESPRYGISRRTVYRLRLPASGCYGG